MIKVVKEAPYVRVISKGDVAGHEFHGNQYTGGGGTDSRLIDRLGHEQGVRFQTEYLEQYKEKIRQAVARGDEKKKDEYTKLAQATQALIEQHRAAIKEDDERIRLTKKPYDIVSDYLPASAMRRKT